MNPKKIQSGLLVALTVSAMSISIKGIIIPSAVNLPKRFTNLPLSIPLKNWTPLSTKSTQDRSDSLSSRQYFYRYSKDILKIETYLMQDGDVKRFLLTHPSTQNAGSVLKVKSHPDIGFYGFLVQNQRLYLTACLNLQKKSTVTVQQFNSVRIHKLSFQHISNWLFNQEDSFEPPCVWTLMSIPLSNQDQLNLATQVKAVNLLESAWMDWFNWWQLNSNMLEQVHMSW